jgi:hypothetical protein
MFAKNVQLWPQMFICFAIFATAPGTPRIKSYSFSTSYREDGKVLSMV